MSICEEQLIEQAAHGDAEAFRHLWEAHHSVAMAAALRLCYQRSLAEEITQGAFLLAWRVYHNYHQLGIIDGGEHRIFHLNKHGSFSVRPCEDGEQVEYLVLTLNVRVHHVHIYRRRMGKEIEVYDMRVA